MDVVGFGVWGFGVWGLWRPLAKRAHAAFLGPRA